MALFKKNYHGASPFIEFLIVSLSLIAILIPLRIISKIIFEEELLGSLGLISIVLGMMLFLSKKEKLGRFGKMFIRQIIKNHKGKRKWFMYIQTALFLSIGILTVFSIHMGNNEYYILKEQIITEFHRQGITESSLNYEGIKQISSQIPLKQQVEVVIALPLLIIQNFEIFSAILAITDNLMGGWVMYFWQVVLIEIIEVSVFLSITRKIFLKS
ncbi:hypothetical protein [Nitrosopumilus ureiphilus]|uniref:Uncharacterized protein n=1 Tax=Nitrosopumilus ureiphilus TaxID=1470067 RepID=A0A7D5M613_9ARCH|nr:hypothetical protein [Nitrosopumilus ureiphilus]QLH06851.1 hypothetical protein C5F50_07000 [Nitrosopumilus ureiphilus]